MNNKKKKTIKKTVKLQSEKDTYLYYEPSLPEPKSNTEQFVRESEEFSDYISRTFPNGYPKYDPYYEAND